jgi:hypothetical protein
MLSSVLQTTNRANGPMGRVWYSGLSGVCGDCYNNSSVYSRILAIILRANPATNFPWPAFGLGFSVGGSSHHLLSSAYEYQGFCLPLCSSCLAVYYATTETDIGLFFNIPVPVLCCVHILGHNHGSITSATHA